MDTRRFVFFGGQGSRQLGSGRPAPGPGDSETNSKLALLLSACHTAFLKETVRARSLGVPPPWARFEVPSSPEALLTVSPEHRSNPILQGVCLCVTQLRAYLASDPSLALHGQSVVAGFCTGILPATVLASSNTLDEYIAHSQQAVRLAYWIGHRAAQISQQIEGDTQWHRYAWAVSIVGIDQEVLQQSIDQFNSSFPAHQAVRISARCSARSFTVVGHGQTLRRFQERCFASGYPAESVSVHALYHGGEQGRQAAKDVLADTVREEISFTQSIPLKRPLLSCQTGRFVDPKSSESLLDEIIQSILVESADLQTTWSTVAGMMRTSSDKWEIVTVGHGAKTLLSLPTGDDPRPPGVSQVDLPGITREGGEDGFAIVGMSVNMPGGSNKDDFWEMLQQGLNSEEHIPGHRFNLEDYREGPRQLNAQHGNFVQDAFALDHRFFGISPREAKSMDPQQKMLLHGTVTALEDAGYVPSLNPSSDPATIGCFIGAATEDYVQNLARDIDVYYSTGTLRAFLSGKLSYAYGWSGPSMVIDTACSSSLVAIASACRTLANGDCSMALAGGVNAITSPDMYIGLSRAHFLSQTGQCKPFDESADGYCRAEGCGLFVIKRVQDAVSDNDRIYGVIRGIEVNQSGNASSITHPHQESQDALLNKVLSRSQVDNRSIDVIEAHGTGTQAGDAVETASIQSVFSDPRHSLQLTSVKGNMGHAEAASGSAGLAKLLLMLNHARIPPQVGLRNLNPKLQSLESHNIHIPTRLLDWSSSRGPRRALLNNFGASGSNAALVVEEFRDDKPTQHPAVQRSAYNWAISAKTNDALCRLVNGYRHFLRKEKDTLRLNDLCFTATARRQLYDYRLSLVCESVSDLAQQLDRLTDLEAIEPCSKSPAPTVFVFSGQGSFYPGMGKELLDTAPAFAETVARCDDILRRSEYGEVLPSEIIRGSSEATSVKSQLVVSQVTCFVVEVALMALFMSCNVHPDVVLGHSLGEYAAMVASEILTVEDALALVVFRAKLMAAHCALGKTGMLACNQSSSSIQSLLDTQSDLSRLSIACDNGEMASVVSGPVAALDLLAQRLKDQNIRCKKMDVALGFHSSSLDPIVEPLHAFCQQLTFNKPSRPVGSCLYGRMLDIEDRIDADYIVRQMRSTVKFRYLTSGFPRDPRYDTATYIEIGPSPITLPMLKSAFGINSAAFLPSLSRDQPAWKTLCHALRQLSFRSDSISWPPIFTGAGARVIDIPGYPVQPSSIYVPYQDPSTYKNHAPTGPARPANFVLLDRIVQRPGSESNLQCATDMSILDDYIQGHMVAGHPLCPASVYHSMVLEAVHWDGQHGDYDVAVLSDMTFGSPLVADKTDSPSPVNLSVETVSDMGRFTFFKDQTSSNKATGHSTLCSGWVSWRSQSELMAFLGRKLAYVKRQMGHLKQPQSQVNVLNRNLIYNIIFPRVVSYSESYQSIHHFWIADEGQEGHGKFRLPPTSSRGGIVAPAFVDTLLHAAGFMANSQARRTDAYICSKVDSVVVNYVDIDPEETLTFYCSLLDCNEGELLGEAYAMMPNGTLVAAVEGMHFKRLNLRAFVSHLSRQITPEKTTTTKIQSPVVSLRTHGSPQPVIQPQEDLSSSELQRVLSIVAAVSELQTDSITEQTRLTDLGMDSLMRIELSQAIQTAFPQLPPESGIAQAETVREIWECIQANKGMSSDSSSATSSRDTNDYESSSISSHMAGSTYDSDPSNDACTTLIHILHNTCEVPIHSLSPDTAMDTLGIDSLMTIELQQSLASAFGEAVSHEELSSDQTIAELCAKLTNKKDIPHRSENKSNSVPAAVIHQLQTGPDHLPPLVLFHDGSGLIEKYDQISPLGCTVLAVQNPVLNDRTHWASSLEEMADHYATSLINRGIPKRVILGGWSFGGVLAHQVAGQLDAHGCKVDAVILIDSPSPGNHQPLPEEVVNYVLDSKPLPSRTLSIMKAQFHNHAQLLGRYSPQPMQSHGRLYVMLQSRDLLDTSRVCGVKYPWLEDPDSRAAAVAQWKAITGRPLVVLDIPGNHFEPFNEKNITTVSEKIGQAYRDVIQQCVQ